MNSAAVRIKGRVLRNQEVFDSTKRPATVLVAAWPVGLPKLWVRKLRGLFAVHELTDPAELEHRLVTLEPDILLLDITIPQFGGIHSLSGIQRLSPSTKIVLLTDRLDKKEWLSGLRAGAWGYCKKAGQPDLLKEALKTIQKGEVWASRALVAEMIEELVSVCASRNCVPTANGPGARKQNVSRRRKTLTLGGPLTRHD
jgi:DNA-binding NarL/FixJ family response regulator